MAYLITSLLILTGDFLFWIINLRTANSLLISFYTWLGISYYPPFWVHFFTVGAINAAVFSLIFLFLKHEYRIAWHDRSPRNILYSVSNVLNQVIGNKGEIWPPFILAPMSILHVLAAIRVIQGSSAAGIWWGFAFLLFGLWMSYLFGVPDIKQKEDDDIPVDESPEAQRLREYNIVKQALWREKWFRNQIMYQIPWPVKIQVGAPQSWRNSADRFQAEEAVYSTLPEQDQKIYQHPIFSIWRQILNSFSKIPLFRYDPFVHQTNLFNIFFTKDRRSKNPKHSLICTPIGSGRTSVAFLAAMRKILFEHRNVIILFPNPRAGRLFTPQLLQALKNSEWDWSFSIFSAWSDSKKLFFEQVTFGDNDPEVFDALPFTPDILITDVQTLHAQILPDHHAYRFFLQQLGMIIMENLEEYQGVFGANVSHVLARLRRVANHYGTDPQILASSVNCKGLNAFFQRFCNFAPDEFKTEEIVDEDGKEKKEKHFILINPELDHESHNKADPVLVRKNYIEQTVKALSTLVKEEYDPILLHKGVEICGADITATNQAITAKMQDELDREIDLAIGTSVEAVYVANELTHTTPSNFDAAVVAGFPGSIVSLLHSVDHIGDNSAKQLIPVLVVLPDTPAAQFVARKAPEFIQRLTNPMELIFPNNNPYILEKHVLAAINELPGEFKEIQQWFGVNGKHVLNKMLDDWKIRKIKHEYVDEEDQLQEKELLELWDVTESPLIDLDCISASNWNLIIDGRHFGSFSDEKIGWAIYPYAIIIMGDQRFEVNQIDYDDLEIHANRIAEPLSTEPNLEIAVKRSDITKLKEELVVDVDMDEIIIHRHFKDGTPVSVVTRKPLWIDVEESISEVRQYDSFTFNRGDSNYKLQESFPRKGFTTRAFGMGFPGANQHILHTLSHLIRSAITLRLYENKAFELVELSKCDWLENNPAVILYDNIPGGTGVADWLADGKNLEELLRLCFDILVSCPCDDGCRGCTTIHNCHHTTNGYPCEVDKVGTIKYLGKILGEEAEKEIKLRTEKIDDQMDVEDIKRHIVEFIFPHKLDLVIENQAPVIVVAESEVPEGVAGLYMRNQDGQMVLVTPNILPELIGLLAHEYAHNWQVYGSPSMHPGLSDPQIVPYFNGKLFVEGFAQWVEYKVADYYGFRQMMDDIQFRHFGEYDEGFRALKWIETQGGSSRVMQFITTGEVEIDGEFIDIPTILQRSRVITSLIKKSKAFEENPPVDDIVDTPPEEEKGNKPEEDVSEIDEPKDGNGKDDKQEPQAGDSEKEPVPEEEKTEVNETEDYIEDSEKGGDGEPQADGPIMEEKGDSGKEKK